MDFTAILYPHPQTPRMGCGLPLGSPRDDHMSGQWVWARRGPSTGGGRRLLRARGRTRPGGRGPALPEQPQLQAEQGGRSGGREQVGGQVRPRDPRWPWPAACPEARVNKALC